MNNKLRVVLSGVGHSILDGSQPSDATVRWRVGGTFARGHRTGEYLCCTDLGFASQHDAERALTALIESGITTIEDAAEVPCDERRRIMCEALMW